MKGTVPVPEAEEIWSLGSNVRSVNLCVLLCLALEVRGAGEGAFVAAPCNRGTAVSAGVCVAQGWGQVEVLGALGHADGTSPDTWIHIAIRWAELPSTEREAKLEKLGKQKIRSLEEGES